MILVTLVGACSSTSRSKSQGAATVSRSQFVAQATTLCNASNEQLGHAAQQAFGAQQPTAGQWRPFMTATVLPIVQQRLDALRGQPVPSGDASTIKAIIDAGTSAIATAKAHPEVMTPGSQAPFDHYDQLAAAYGLGACAVGG
ncbi:MAG TPA: hypothetical protein VHA73_05275 [Acidimicrobiales bacterium]|jgi:hypothetical protein|nr:hypothetical protein [Acidimicrobiales bacterium]